MGRKLTERQKAKRAAEVRFARQRKEMGPLFAHQAVRPDVAQVLMERRRGLARLVEHGQGMAGDHLLDQMMEFEYRRQVMALVSPEEFAQIDQARKVYPHRNPVDSSTYGVGFWVRQLCRLSIEMPERWWWQKCSTCKLWHAQGRRSVLMGKDNVRDFPTLE